MMKRMKKVSALALAAVAALSCVGCAPEGDGIVIDKARTQLYISYFNSGYGSAWLTEATKRFEPMYAEYSFEPGKKGVQIVPVPEALSDMSTIMATGPNSSVFFCDIYDQGAYRSQGVLADITDAVTTSLGESYGKDINGTPLPAYEGETKSIAEKYSAEEFISHATKVNGEYTFGAVPYIDTCSGSWTYDADVFEKYFLYFNSNNVIATNKAMGNLGLGPDGVANTADDGLPRTLDEMETLITKMISYGIVPFNSWGGSFLYSNDAALSLLISSLGEDVFKSVLTGSGTMPNVIADPTTVENGYTTESKTFNESTAHRTVLQTEASYRIAQFYQKVATGFDGKAYRWVDATSGIYSQYQAQRDFYFGAELARDYGILVDGTWWMIEAEKEIKDYEAENSESKTRIDRNVLFMPFPKATEADWERLRGENMQYQAYRTGIAVRSGLSEMQQLLAETFVRFYCTDYSLYEYTKIVSQPRGLQYTFDDTQYESLTPYARSLYSIKTSDEEHGYGTYKAVANVTESAWGVANAGTFKMGSKIFMSTKGTGILNSFYNDADLTADAYFKGYFA